MLKILPDMVRLDKEEKNSMSSFCSYINTNKDNLTLYQKGVVADYIISNIVGVNVKDINVGIYNLLKNYLISNIGEISFYLHGDSIKEICLGNIKAGPLFSSNFSNEELSDRFLSGKNSCGVLPTKGNMKKLFIGYEDKNIYSDNIVHSDRDYKNVHIGEYYFNRDDVLKDVENPYIFKFKAAYEDELEIEVLNFSKDGIFIDSDIYVDYLESDDLVNYKVEKQLHNSLEDINSLRSILK